MAEEPWTPKTGIEGLGPGGSKEGRVTEGETEKLEVVVRMKCLEFVRSEVVAQFYVCVCVNSLGFSISRIT